MCSRPDRRRLLAWGVGGAAAAAASGAAGLALVARGLLPGRTVLDQLDGTCSVPASPVAFATPGPELAGQLASRARRRTVGYTIAYPPGHRPGSELPLVVMLHGYGRDHASALPGMSPAQALALRVGGRPLAPVAMVAADGGGGYWNAHPGDDPFAMVVDELIPMCQERGLGLSRGRIGAMGISMGGYGALHLAEQRPDLVAAVAAVSPAVWLTYAEARAANAGAFASAAAFADGDVVTHAAALSGMPVRVATGRDDPFRPGFDALVQALPSGAVAVVSRGCHTDEFFEAQVPPSLAFLAAALTRGR